MSHRALEPLDAARIGDTRDPYRAERLRAQMQAARVVPARHAAFARLQASVGRPEPAPNACHVGSGTSFERGSHCCGATADCSRTR